MSESKEVAIQGELASALIRVFKKEEDRREILKRLILQHQRDGCRSMHMTATAEGFSGTIPFASSKGPYDIGFIMMNIPEAATEQCIAALSCEGVPFKFNDSQMQKADINGSPAHSIGTHTSDNGRVPQLPNEEES